MAFRIENGILSRLFRELIFPLIFSCSFENEFVWIPLLKYQIKFHPQNDTSLSGKRNSIEFQRNISKCLTSPYKTT